MASKADLERFDEKINAREYERDNKRDKRAGRIYMMRKNKREVGYAWINNAVEKKNKAKLKLYQTKLKSDKTSYRWT